MKLGYELTIEQTQKLVMTPELIQAIQILQFNSQELESYVQEQLLANPVLENAEPDESPECSNAGDEQDEDLVLDWKEFIRNSNYGGVEFRGAGRQSGDDQGNSIERFSVSDETLEEYLMFQYQFAPVNRSCRHVGKYIIESLDENGYMTSTVEEIAAVTGVSVNRVSKLLEIIQGFDPAGVGARDIRECLKIQLKATDRLTPAFEKIIDCHLEDIASNRMAVVAKSMGITAVKAQEMADVIRNLEPKPGRQFASEGETKYIVPDVYVDKTEDGYAVTVNESNSPHLMVSSYYRSLLHQADTDSELAEYLSERVNSASWLIKSIEQRKKTIFNVVTTVVKFQKEFFDLGSKHMKVLTLKDVAEEIGVHESTVSRSISGKYLQCPRGVYEIKHFFSAGVAGAGGEGISSNSVKEFMKELIDGENHAKPLSDQKIVALLEEKGFEISRRTVAKYRDEMGILSSSRRKRY